MSRDPRSLVFEQSTRHVAFFKTLQFFLLTWFISGALFPEHPWVETMMRNNVFAVNCMFVLSGVLTHLRYRPFFDTVCQQYPGRHVFRALPKDPSFSIYVYLRIVAFLPVVILAILWAMLHLNWDLLQLLLSVTHTSSIFSLYPSTWGGLNSELVMPSAPIFLMASCLTICWLVYPFACGALQWLNAAVSSKRGQRWSAALTFGILAFLTPAIVCLAVRNLRLEDSFYRAIEKTYLDHTTLLGAAGWLMNPIFKLPLFLAGVATAELMYALDWTNVNMQCYAACHWTVQWVLPFLTDVIAFFCVCLFEHDPKDEPALPLRAVSRWLVYPSGLDQRQQWTMAGPYYTVPLVCVGFLLLGAPFAHRGLTWRVLCQDPVMAVLPGRTAVFLSFFYTLVLKSFSVSLQEEFLGGAGLLLIIFCFFVTSVPAYYYVYQPWHIWLSLRCANVNLVSKLRDNEETSTVADSPADLRALSDDEDCPESIYKVLKSPNYDPYFINDDAKEIKLYQHLDQIEAPSFESGKAFFVSSLEWFRGVFIDFHYVHQNEM